MHLILYESLSETASIQILPHICTKSLAVQNGKDNSIKIGHYLSLYNNVIQNNLYGGK